MQIDLVLISHVARTKRLLGGGPGDVMCGDRLRGEVSQQTSDIYTGVRPLGRK